MIFFFIFTYQNEESIIKRSRMKLAEHIELGRKSTKTNCAGATWKAEISPTNLADFPQKIGRDEK